MRCGSVAAIVVISGCALLPSAWLPLAPDELSTGKDSIYDLGAEFDLPEMVLSAAVRVELENRSAHGVEARVTMRVVGEQVHYSLRYVPAETESMIIGPDRADSVLVEGTLLTDPPVSLPMHTFFLGTDFQSGDTIHVILAEAEDQDDQLDDGDGDSDGIIDILFVSIEELDSDTRINAGTEVPFDMVSAGGSAAAELTAFADPDDDLDNGNEVVVVEGLAAAERTTVTWDTAGTAPGRYTLYAEIHDGEGFARSDPAPGRVRINAQPMLVFDSPVDGLLVTRGRPFVISWAGQDDDDDAVITVFLDLNDEFEDGYERILRDGISEDDTQDRELIVDTSDLELDVYFVGGLISDGLTDTVVYAGRVCITDRLVGRFNPTEADFGPGEMTTLHGAENSVALGAAIDVSRDLNGDGQADLLVSDPRAWDLGGQQPEVGEVYYHESDIWPRHLDTSQLTLRIVGEATETGVGMRVAFLPPINDDPEGDILIGAPHFSWEPPWDPIGRAYVLNGTAVDDLDELFLDQLKYPQGGTVTGDPNQPSEFGLDVAALGDVDGDGVADYAVAATEFDWLGGPQPQVGAGVVALIAGGALPDNTPFYGIGCEFLRGAFAIGVLPDGLAGYAVRGVPDFGDQADGVAIGAPGASLDGSLATGVVYVVRGPLVLAEDCQGSGDFYLDDVGDAQGVRGHVFVGENDGDLAGAALASGDFDGDGRTDLLIGAPGYDGTRGRVYLIYDIECLPEQEGERSLADVGGSIPGVVFDGVAWGDRSGWSLSTAGDFDYDGADDVLVGAPGTESERGAAFLVYGGQALPGSVSLATIGTCDFAGLQLVGELPASRLGWAVSGGASLDGDASSDVGIGAPGDGVILGRAFILFGMWSELPDDGLEESGAVGPLEAIDVRPLP